MTEHNLKSWPEFYDAMERGRKTFEARRNDRNFEVGDTLLIYRTKAENSGHIDFTKRPLRRIVTYILHGPRFGIEQGYCVLGLIQEP